MGSQAVLEVPHFAPPPHRLIPAPSARASTDSVSDDTASVSDADTFEAPATANRVTGTVGLDIDALRRAYRMIDRRRNAEKPAPWPSEEAVSAEARAPWFEDPEFQRKLDKTTDSRAFAGNWTNILVDGPTSFAQKVANIRTADVIFLKIYLWNNDESGRWYASELEKAAARGARIYIQYGVKSLYGPGRLALIKQGMRPPLPPVLKGLSKYSNVYLAPNDRPDKWRRLLLRRDHEKYLITWRHGEAVRLIMGGMNISDAWIHGGDPYACPKPRIQYRDTDVEIIGPTAKDAVLQFMADLAAYDPSQVIHILRTQDEMTQTSQNVLYPPSEENSVVRFVRNMPRHHDDRAQFIKKLYIELLDRVPNGEPVHIENAYLLPGKDLQAAMRRASARGVRISLVTNSPVSPEFEGRILGTTSRNFFRKFIRKTKCTPNTRFYEFVGNPNTGHNSMHQKIASFGRHGPYIIGSSNLDQQSLYFNKECVALIYDARGRAAFDALWKRDITERRKVDGQLTGTAHELTPTMLKKESVFKKAQEKFYYSLKKIL